MVDVSDQPLVLSLFPGIGLLDHAFELEGFCVVRGPDVLWGGDVRRFHPPAGKFDGVIGGPPCQAFSKFVNLTIARGCTPKPNLIPEFERCVDEAQPAWFVMENVPAAPEPGAQGYAVTSLKLNNRWIGGEQNRVRRFSLGSRDGLRLDVSPDVCAFENPLKFSAVVADRRETPVKIGGSGKLKPEYRNAVTAAHAGSRDFGNPIKRYTIAEACYLQGVPGNFLEDAPFTQQGKLQVLANGVPIPMGRAIARAVRRALGLPILTADEAAV